MEDIWFNDREVTIKKAANGWIVTSRNGVHVFTHWVNVTDFITEKFNHIDKKEILNG